MEVTNGASVMLGRRSPPFFSRASSQFRAVEWQNIADSVDAYTRSHSPCMVEVVASVRACGAGRLAGLMSMHDLAVTTTPVPQHGPIELIWVRPQGRTSGRPQMVLVEHWSCTGHDDLIVRPATEAVALFWRFVIEKFGFEPVCDQGV